jgi:hypothetical protein
MLGETAVKPLHRLISYLLGIVCRATSLTTPLLQDTALDPARRMTRPSQPGSISVAWVPSIRSAICLWPSEYQDWKPHIPKMGTCSDQQTLVDYVRLFDQLLLISVEEQLVWASWNAGVTRHLHGSNSPVRQPSASVIFIGLAWWFLRGMQRCYAYTTNFFHHSNTQRCNYLCVARYQ